MDAPFLASRAASAEEYMVVYPLAVELGGSEQEHMLDRGNDEGSEYVEEAGDRGSGVWSAAGDR